MIQYHATFDILDATKIQAYMDCARAYFFEFILGWRSELPNIHLEYGTGLHLSLAHLLTHGYSTEEVMKAYNLFREYFHEKIVSILGDEHPKKNLANTFTSLSEYAALYENDLTDFEVLDTEIAGRVALSLDPTRYLYFRIDAAITGKILERQGSAIMEHKTGSNLNTYWKEQWIQRTQVGIYYHVARCLLPEQDVVGVVINGFFPNSPIRFKANGEPYVNDTGPQFHRMLIHKTDMQMEAWRQNTIEWHDDIRKDTAKVMNMQEGEPVMSCFKKNDGNCTKYFGCPYKDFCRAWPNPTDKPLQSGFKEEHWNPEKVYTEKAKKVVEL